MDNVTIADYVKDLSSIVKEVNVFPMVKYYMDQLNIYDTLNILMPSASQSEITTAQVLCVMIANIAIAKHPLYKIDNWFSQYVDGRTEERSEESFQYNDDRCGRGLDKLYAADRNSLMTLISAKAIEVHQLELQQVNNDSTSISFAGAYDNSKTDEVNLTYGFSKDNKPDCKQVVFGLTTTADGHVPIQYELFDGNRTDDTTHIGTWDSLRQLAASTDFVYIADSKLCTMNNLRHISSNGGTFITVLPKNRTEVSELHKQLATGWDIPWQEELKIPSTRKKDEFNTYKLYEGATTCEECSIFYMSDNKFLENATTTNGIYVLTTNNKNVYYQYINGKYTQLEVQQCAASATSATSAVNKLKATVTYSNDKLASLFQSYIPQTGYRVIWVLSRDKAKQDLATRTRRIKTAIEQLTELKPKLNKRRFTTREYIQQKIDEINKHGFLSVMLTENIEIHKKQLSRGKPTINTKYQEIEKTVFTLDWQHNHEAIQQSTKTDGLFPLISNSTETKTKILQRYKTQPFLEKRFQTAKSVLEVAPVFLKKPKRIEAMMFLYFIALMIISLIERNIRQQLALAPTELRILPENRNTKTPTWNNIREFFSNIYLNILEYKQEFMSKLCCLSKLHQLVLTLLKVPIHIYSKLQDNWWQFELVA